MISEALSISTGWIEGKLEMNCDCDVLLLYASDRDATKFTRRTNTSRILQSAILRTKGEDFEEMVGVSIARGSPRRNYNDKTILSGPLRWCAASAYVEDRFIVQIKRAKSFI